MLLIKIFLPALLYAVVLGLTGPWGTIKWRRALLFFGAGIVSVTILRGFWFLIWDWGEPVEFWLRVVKAAWLEEVAKWMAFWMAWRALPERSPHPWQVMFYMAITALGFATVENMEYVTRMGQGVLPGRLITSTVMHQVFGMITGYWVATGSIRLRKGRSVFSVVTSKEPIIKRLVYWVIAVSAATGFHALYNWNLYQQGASTDTILWLIILIGLWASFQMKRALLQTWYVRKGVEGILKSRARHGDK